MPDVQHNAVAEFSNRRTETASQSDLVDSEQFAVGATLDEHPSSAGEGAKSGSLLSRARSIDPHNRRSLFRR